MQILILFYYKINYIVENIISLILILYNFLSYGFFEILNSILLWKVNKSYVVIIFLTTFTKQPF